MSELFSGNRDLSRRAVLHTGAGVLAATMIPECLQAKPRKPEFTFVVANDLHYRDKRCGEWLGKVAASIRELRPRPAFVVLNGDLSEDGTVEQIGAVQEIFRSLPMPVFSTVGNHDYTGDERCEAFEKVIGPRRNYRFDHGDWQFLALDTTYGRGVYRTWIRGETLGWLDANLRAVSREKPLVVITHFPLGWNWLRPLNASSVNARLKGYNVREVISGHWHGWTERRESGVHFATGRCCSWWRNNHDRSDRKGYFLCRAGESGFDYEFVGVGPGEKITHERRPA